jgi:23S rRNA pseudouridine1911/1915/1917 synthase
VTGYCFTVAPEFSGLRLDRYLAEQIPGASRSQVQRLIEDGQVQVDGRMRRSSDRLDVGQQICVDQPTPTVTGIVATDMSLDILRETSEFVVVNKPAGLVVHPAPGHRDDTLANALMARHPNLTVGNALRPGIVHRLDKGTSGLMVVALSDAMYQSLIDQMKRRTVHKEYIAVVHGQVTQERGTIDAPIGRDRRDRQKMGIVPEGREARTHFQVLERFRCHTLLRLGLETGRTHQIRVHLASIGHPIYGDQTYGGRGTGVELGRPFLHSWYLGFEVPGDAACVVTWAELPPDLESVLTTLRDEVAV